MKLILPVHVNWQRKGLYCAEQGLSVNLSVSTTKQFESESVSVAATTGCASGFLKKLVPSSHSRASLQLETSRRVYRVVQEDFTLRTLLYDV